MTFAPAKLVDLGRYFSAHDVVNLGIVGDTAHQAKGTSYHLGADQLAAGAYSTILPRDKAGLSNAASAIDIGKFDGSFVGLRSFSTWLVDRAKAGAVGTNDIREIIFSPDGRIVQRWDNAAKKLYLGGTGTGQGDNTHLYHTHISYWRDSESRDKLAAVNPYFSPIDPLPGGEPMATAQVIERWHPTVTAGQSNGVLRATMDRAAPIVERIPATGSITTVAEFVGTENWRLVQTTDRSVKYALRSDWISDGPPPPTDTAAAYNAGVTAAVTLAATARK